MRFAPGAVQITAGEEHVGAWEPEGGFAKLFCSNCGGALWSQSRDEPDVISVRMGTFDADPGIRPAWRAYVAYAAPWEEIPNDGLPRYPERAPA